MEWVWMRNAETGGVQKFAAAAVDEWRGMGWEPCDPPAGPNLALDPNHPALARYEFVEPAPEGGEAFVPKRDEDDAEGTVPPARRKSTTGRAPASDKEE